ncbi:hypothetical protein [Shewanella pneumatophori]|uniref:CopL family metal-binding regulatory protein n=1 Tax=Shewanella pneumatophori TaxID=314092 RepID=A0A9X1ZAP6_9GAMM|nr:hypothetical protein [Shewanella pneumatophori]MCL1138143.1 hypothetical protein [Shewanella pneumatophori]
MFSIIRRHTLIAITLLALLSQLVLSNGSLMVAKAMADDMPMMSMQDGADCHQVTMDINNSDDDCCEIEANTQALAEHSPNCCNGSGSCQSDCSHCLVISVTGTLFSVSPWPGFSTSEIVMATPMPHFHSISLPQDLRPPIA